MKIDDLTISSILCTLIAFGIIHLFDIFISKIRDLIREAVMLYSENRLYRAWKKTLERKIDEATRVEKE